MILQLFGLLDIFAGVALILAHFDVTSSLFLTMGIIIILKSLVYFGGFASFVDIFGAIWLLVVDMSTITPWPALTGLFIFWFFQKGVFSFFS